MSKPSIITTNMAGTSLSLQILEKLSQFGELPVEGVLAGQAVASAIAEIFKLDWIKPVYNDLDVFRIQTDGEAYLAPSFKVARIKTPRRKEHYAQVDGYGQFRGVYTDVKYNVVSSRRYDMLNDIIIYKTNKRMDASSFMRMLIDDFDINSVQVGIDLQTLELYGSDNFWSFMTTRQLQIENFSTSGHSLIRLLKKLEEYGDGVYCDLKTNALLAAKTISSSDSGMPFGIKLMGQAMRHVKQLEALGFTLVQKETRVGSYPIYCLRASYKAATESLSLFKGTPWGNERVHLYFSEVRHAYKIASAKQSFKDALFKEDDNGRDYRSKNFLSSLICAKPSVITDKVSIDLLNSKKSQKAAELIRSHGKLATIFYANGAAKGIALLNFLSQEEKKQGSQYYIGFVEGMQADEIPGSIEETKKLLVKKAEEAKSSKIAPMAHKEIVHEGYSVRELTSHYELVEEGSHQHHCVGGYIWQIQGGHTRIVSVKSKDRKMDMTVEVIKREDSWMIAQAMYRHNVPVSSELRSDLLAPAISALLGVEVKAHFPRTVGVNVPQRILELQNDAEEDIPF